jgi:hypothetical protein
MLNIDKISHIFKETHILQTGGIWKVKKAQG